MKRLVVRLIMNPKQEGALRRQDGDCHTEVSAYRRRGLRSSTQAK